MALVARGHNVVCEFGVSGLLLLREASAQGALPPNEGG